MNLSIQLKIHLLQNLLYQLINSMEEYHRQYTGIIKILCAQVSQVFQLALQDAGEEILL